jgi:hypothetical protein
MGTVRLVSRAQPQRVIDDFKQLVVHLKPRTTSGLPVPPPATLRQIGARFVPEFLVIARGQSVRFPNEDDIFHNVFSASPTKAFDLGLYKRDQNTTKVVTFDRPGLVKIHCAIHETMNATIFVAESPYFAVIDGGSRFVIEAIAPGDYQVLTWHRRFPTTTLELRVQAGQQQVIQLELGGESHVAR